MKIFLTITTLSSAVRKRLTRILSNSLFTKGESESLLLQPYSFYNKMLQHSHKSEVTYRNEREIHCSNSCFVTYLSLSLSIWSTILPNSFSASSGDSSEKSFFLDPAMTKMKYQGMTNHFGGSLISPCMG